MNRYEIMMEIEGIVGVAHVEAEKLEQKGHETVYADGIRIDLPGNILHTHKKQPITIPKKFVKRFAETAINPKYYGKLTINPKRDMIELGSQVKDTITSYKGIVVGRCEWLHGCTRVIVESEDLKDGKPIDPQWFDEQRVEVLKGPSAKIKKTIEQKDVPPGGPMPDPKPAKAPTR
jgi:hypothetical protein